ncbi:hypothetical protein AX14_009515 [Amanita brunnescens Koide BX004]|nr:hypothetical protein AX14_009515 [Amanita brunnescens Koide BX004]
MNTLSTMVDFAIARHLDEHVKDGYTYLIQNYRPGDKICLFGFSRGAHTARVVAGMIYKVGILPRENLQQVDFAFNIYMTTGYEGYKLSREFKLTFASHVDIDFVGVWDTVSSVGIIPQTHPYTSINYSVKCFRHALALDERRTRFRPNVWSELTVEREQELDIDLPAPKEPDLAAPNGILGTRDDWEYSPPERDHADVKEVWFAGSHSDVGGGSHTTKRNHSLSFIPLRWMIKECILTKTGIQFDMEYLRDSLDFDFHELVTEMEEKDMKIEDLGQAYQGIENYAQESFEQAQERQERAKAKAETQSDSPQTHVHGFRHYIHDVIDTIFDQLLLVWFWWILEFLPMLSTYQDLQGNWIRVRMRNFGRGRYIPFYKDQILVHKTVDVRINTAGQRRYKPKARNWDTVEKSPMLKYVT